MELLESRSECFHLVRGQLQPASFVGQVKADMVVACAARTDFRRQLHGKNPDNLVTRFNGRFVQVVVLPVPPYSLLRQPFQCATMARNDMYCHQAQPSSSR